MVHGCLFPIMRKACLTLWMPSPASAFWVLENEFDRSLGVCPSVRTPGLGRKNLSICFPVVDVSGFASTHFVKLSMATTRNLAPPGAIRIGPTMSIPHYEKGHADIMDVISCFGFLGIGE
ncbi:hypothetical protein Tco_0782380 [Tanacetum coccineum]